MQTQYQFSPAAGDLVGTRTVFKTKSTAGKQLFNDRTEHRTK